MKIGSLFSGIGGLELGLEWAGLGHTVWQVEVDEGCRRILAKHWPDARRFNDVREVGALELEPVDLICGGFPCQDLSSAGKRVGLAGARSGLWFEYLRIVRELRPSWVVVENVASGAASWVDTVRRGLGQSGYEVLSIPLGAADVGAPHLRKRIFVVAHTDKAVLRVEQRRGGWQDRTREKEPTESRWQQAQPDLVRVVHGLSRKLDKSNARIAALGNAVVPQCAEVVGHVIRELSRP